MGIKMTEEQKLLYEMINNRFDRIEDVIKEDRDSTDDKINALKGRVDGHDRIIWKASGVIGVVGVFLGYLGSWIMRKS